ncbi:type II CRISPR RNA-guided endonuclease Cas9 [Fontivita pretiosa]|uniref:type II CRISPR RNA-guided endonuclease Cas9 n=1 Tax=Fontivita pretiosa TaxID=2989684 RepID=UPI003D16C28B
MAKTLGLDLGPNSIGWALIEDNADGTGRLIDCGVRVFPEGVDAFDTGKENSRSEQRRMARMMRRQIRRRARRRRIVEAALVEARLLPADDVERRQILALDPYPLRARAVAERLQPFEIGRVIYHLNQRRGFLSLKKVSKAKIEKELKSIEKKRAADRESAVAADGEGAIKKEDESKMLAQIELLARRIGDRTLGQALYEQQTSAARTTNGSPIPLRIRNQHTRRLMIEDEFLRIWEHQKQYHPNLLTDAACFGTVGRQDAQRTREPIPRDHSKTPLEQFGLHGLIFFQRPIYWPREMIGMCELEKGHRRCPKADRHAQRFRILQEINNLRYTPPGVFDEKRLDDQQRAALLDALGKKEKIEFDAIRKLLELPDGTKFNLERGERSSIKGHITDARLAREWKDWHKLDEQTRDRIVRVLIDAQRDSATAREKLLAEFRLSEQVSDALLSVDLPDGYVSLSLKAIDKLLPHLERGLILMGKTHADESAMRAAGYLRRDELQRRLFDKLPSLQMIRTGPLADLPNPVVSAAMHELRRVVNAIVREYGRPDAVHIEMARSLKMSSEKRREYNKAIHERAEERERIAGILRQNKIVPTRDAILKYRLWQEQQEKCIYTGRPISFEQLYNGETDIDHILPYSLTLDDSQMNKVVCFRDANREKNQRSPYEWLAGRDPQRLRQIQQWAECLPFAKRRKLAQQEIRSEDFLERQLNDTGYIARLAVTYLEMLVQNKHDVQGRKGTYTADLRHHWGLDNLLESLPDSPAWQEKSNLSPGEKNRADHRHHALDAIVIALTNRKTLAAMHQGKETVNHTDKQTGEVVEYQRFTKDIPPPWGMDREEFRQMVLDKLRAVNVSHRVRRGLRGALHEDSFYGPVYSPKGGQRVEGQFVKRKPVESLTMNEIQFIRDKAIRELVIGQLAAHGIKPGRGAEKVPPKKMQQAMAGLKMPSGVPIRRVRIVKKDDTIRPLREGRPDEAWVKPGSTHHLCIFEWDEPDKKGKPKRVRDAVFVSMLEAKRRARSGEPIIQRTHPNRPDARFVMSLTKGELVLAKWKGYEHPLQLVMSTSVSTEKKATFYLATDARKSDQRLKFNTGLSLLNARKVTVDPLGRIRWAND